MGNEWARYPCHTCESAPAQVLTCLVEFSGACFFCISATCFTGKWKIMNLLQPFSNGLGLVYLLACVCNVTAALADAYGTHETERFFDLLATNFVTVGAMFFNATLLVLLVQNSVGIAAITRATIHGAVHTTWWFLVYATLAQIVDSVDTVPRLHMFLVAAGLDLGWWMMYFGGLELMNACLPDCCCIRGMLPQALKSSAVILALTMSLFLELAWFAIFLWGHYRNHEPSGTHHHQWEWPSIVTLCYMAVFPAAFYFSALQQTRYWQSSGVHTAIEGSDGLLDWTDFHKFEELNKGGGATVYKGLRYSDSSQVCLRFILTQELTIDGASEDEQLRKLEIATTIAAQLCASDECKEAEFRVVKYIGYYINPPHYVMVYKLYDDSLTRHLGIGLPLAKRPEITLTNSGNHDERQTASPVAIRKPRTPLGRANTPVELSASFPDSLQAPFAPAKTALRRVRSWSFQASKEERRPLSERLEIGIQVAKAVAHLHHLSKPIIHRDIKPSNFLVQCHSHDDIRVVLADFGEAVFYKEGTDVLIKSSLFYQPPELLAASKYFKYERSSDVYSLACTLWQILTNQELYHECKSSKSCFELEDRVQDGSRRPDTHANWQPQDRDEDAFLELITKAWDQEPSRRPSAESISQQLELIYHKHCETHVTMNPTVGEGALGEERADPPHCTKRELDPNPGAITII